jgi:hypothetical protein
MRNKTLIAIIEIAFIMFLFYSNLLMGEFERSGHAAGKGLVWALGDVFTVTNFAIGLVAALVGYMVVESLRNRIREYLLSRGNESSQARPSAGNAANPNAGGSRQA